MKELLFLAHRIPYPPDKGDKIRSFHELEHLSRSFRIHLGAFVDDPRDWRHEDAVSRYCASTCLLPLDRRRARLRSLLGLLTGQALSLPYYRDRRMQGWVNGLVASRPLSAVLVFSSAMAQYVGQLEAPRRILDFVDVDSEKWRQYAEERPWPANWIYRREGKRLLAFDRAMAGRFDRSLFVSPAEAAVFAGLAPEAARRLAVVRNGVDAGYFCDDGVYPNPYPAGRVLVFVGAMDYWPNIDAVTWFANAVFPAVRQACPDACFVIVGSRPDRQVQALGDRPGIAVTGRVDDVRPYLAHALLAVAPLRVARGVQNKVLEAMAMGKPLLTTPPAMQGIDALPGLAVKIADTADDWVHMTITAISDASWQREAGANRRFVLDYYDWTHNLADLERFISQ